MTDPSLPLDVPSLSLIVPVYNEARRLSATLEAIGDYLHERFPTAEVIVADDGSLDESSALARAAAERWPRVRLLTLSHRGKGHAVRAGMMASRGTVRLFCDADLAVPLSAIETFMEAAQSADIVIASREAPGARRTGEPPSRRLMGRVFNLLARWIAGLPYRDTQCGFKAFRAEAAEALFARQRVDGFGFDAETLFLAHRAGLKIVEVPVEWHYRTDSRIRWLHPLTMTLELLRIRWNAWRGRYER